MKAMTSRRVARWCLAILLTAAMAVGGCKKDEPQAPATPAKAEKAGEAKGGEAKGGDEKGGEAKGGDEKGGEAKGGEAAAPAAVATPDSVILYAGVKSLDDFTTRISSVIDKVKPMPGLSAIIAGALSKELGVTNMDWLDTSKPIRVVVANPKESGKPALLTFPMKSREAFEKALPEAREAGGDGAAFKYQAGSRDAYVSYAGDYAVFARDAKVFDRAKGFVEGGLAKYQPNDLFEVTFAVGNITRIFADELKQARGGMGQMMAANQAGNPFQASAEIMQKEVDMLFDLLEQLDTASISARIDGDHVKIPFSIRAKDGTSVATFIKGAKGRSLSLLDYIPSGSYFAFGANMDPAGFSEWNQLGIGMLAEILKLSDAEKTKIGELMQKGMESQTGESMMAFYKEGSLALSLLAVGGAKDGKKLRDVTYEMYGLLWSKLIDMVKAEAGALPPEVDLSSFPKAIESLGKLAEPMGIGVKIGSEEYAGAPIDTLTITIDYAKFPLAQEDPKATEVMKAIVGDKIVLAAGYGKDRYAMALGPEAVARVKEVIDGKKGGAPAAVKTAVEHGVRGAAMLFYISAVDGLKAFAAVPELAPMREKIRGMVSSNGAAFSMGGDGTALSAVLDIPVSHVQEVLKLQ